MGLRAETVEQVCSYWRAWAAAPVTTNAVGVVVIGDEQFVSAPDRVRGRLDDVRDLDSLVAVLGHGVERVGGEARLAYAEEATVRLPASDGVIDIEDDDVKLAALEAASARSEWTEASADEACDRRVGIVENDALLSVATMQVWNDAIGQIGVFTAADARGRGLASRGGSAVVRHTLASSLVPQWRSRKGLEASARVADKLGFVALGRQVFVRVKPNAFEF